MLFFIITSKMKRCSIVQYQPTANPPLGSPVEPLVYIITATSLGLGPFLIMDATR